MTNKSVWNLFKKHSYSIIVTSRTKYIYVLKYKQHERGPLIIYTENYNHLYVYVGAVIDQHPGRAEIVLIPLIGKTQLERRPTLGILDADLCLVAEQQPHDLGPLHWILAAHRRDEGRAAVFVLGVDVAADSQEVDEHTLVPVDGRQVQEAAWLAVAVAAGVDAVERRSKQKMVVVLDRLRNTLLKGEFGVWVVAFFFFFLNAELSLGSYYGIL